MIRMHHNFGAYNVAPKIFYRKYYSPTATSLTSHISSNGCDQSGVVRIDVEGTIPSFPRDFEETDALFLEFKDAFNNAGGSSLMGDTSEYIDVVKGALRRYFVLDFTNQALLTIKCSHLSRSSGETIIDISKSTAT
ncbi:cytochrome P450 CYP82D47-like [Cucumis melo var. makuwa]|uniref:Cytochrome P450 CYP82D47-like n=1 Tax=Cucumis melo var. makuwa TaxID=1194695 RepID=A0A5A7UXC6_CUCMM|nr:cytochrome P450 CYP82D47-like [Cucumis melo var. makuwa]TYK24820.1 cytochrome P450 CYP82D47-like [Cucumis melo var. makuwa]